MAERQKNSSSWLNATINFVACKNATFAKKHIFRKNYRRHRFNCFHEPIKTRALVQSTSHMRTILFGAFYIIYRKWSRKMTTTQQSKFSWLCKFPFRELIRIEFNGLKIVIADVKRCKPLSIDIQGIFGDSKLRKIAIIVQKHQQKVAG